MVSKTSLYLAVQSVFTSLSRDRYTDHSGTEEEAAGQGGGRKKKEEEKEEEREAGAGCVARGRGKQLTGWKQESESSVHLWGASFTSSCPRASRAEASAKEEEAALMARKLH